MENEEVIRQHMEQTRESLTDKLETLEKKVLSSVDKATSAVTDTVASVKESVHEGVETVKDAVDVPGHVERRPWLMLGGSIVCGFVLGTLLTGRKKSAPPPVEPSPQPLSKALRVPGNGHPKGEKPQAIAETPNWLSALEPELQHLKGLALGVTLGTLREMLADQAPPHIAEQLRTIIDGVTEKIGAEPIPSSDFATAACPAPASGDSVPNAEFDIEKPRW